MLVDEEGALSLSQVVMDVDCFASLKIALLLPYEAIQIQCLNAVEEKLKQGGGTPDVDHELLALLLSSGIISNVITSSAYGTIFSYVCGMVGNLCRKSMEEEGKMKLDSRRLILPCFISELVKSGQQVVAGLLVTKLMHTNASLSLLSVAESSLRKYLETQQLQAEQELDSCLVNTISNLRQRSQHLFRSALTSLSASVR
jgi:hypothetical protein